MRAEEMWEPHYALADSLREGERCDAAISVPKKWWRCALHTATRRPISGFAWRRRAVGSGRAGVSSGLDHRSGICAATRTLAPVSSRRGHGARHATSIFKRSVGSGTRGCSWRAVRAHVSRSYHGRRGCAAKRGCSPRQHLVSSEFASSVTSIWRWLGPVTMGPCTPFTISCRGIGPESEI